MVIQIVNGRNESGSQVYLALNCELFLKRSLLKREVVEYRTSNLVSPARLIYLKVTLSRYSPCSILEILSSRHLNLKSAVRGSFPYFGLPFGLEFLTGIIVTPGGQAIS